MSAARISIIVPAFNEQGNIEKLEKEVSKIIGKYEYEIIFVNDGSTDNTAKIIKNMAKKDHRIKYINLSRNFGHQSALRAGLKHATGEAVISLDADLQHPPALIPKLIKNWEKGYKVVYTVREDSDDVSFFKRKASKFFYRLMNFLGGLNIQYGSADFRLLDRRVVNLINEEPETNLFLRGYINWLGFRQIGIPYKANPRYSGERKYSFRKMIALAFNGITQHSIKPLRMAFLLSIGAFGLSLVYVVYVLWIELISHSAVPGWASIIILFIFFEGINFLLLGLVGEYIGRTYLQTKSRPDYIIDDSNTLTKD